MTEFGRRKTEDGRRKSRRAEGVGRNQAGFTMIEMLVVIGILVLLAGLLLPAVLKALNFAQKANVYEDMHELEAAWTAYLTDYRSFPDVAIRDMNPDAVRLLSGDTNVFSRSNFLGKKYMEFTRVQQASGFFDYWGDAAIRGGALPPTQTNRLYQVALDNGLGVHDTTGKYDGEVSPYPDSVVTKSVVVWSRGKNGRDTTEEDRKDDVRIW